jgi:hypothetical protein
VPTIQRYEAEVQAREKSASSDSEATSPSHFSFDSMKDLPKTPRVEQDDPANASNKAAEGGAHMDGAHEGEGVPVGQEKEAKKSEKQAVMDRMQGPKQKPTDAVKNKRGERTVKDPTTGQMVTIKDAEFKGGSRSFYFNTSFIVIFQITRTKPSSILRLTRQGRRSSRSPRTAS